VEPVAGNMGCVKSTAAFRTALRELTEKHGALLIFDEVITGFRVAYGGAQSVFGIRPDLTTLGKIIGGGLPVGVYGGRADIMRHVLPVGKVFQAGTLSGNPLATAAGIATLKILRDTNPYPRLQQLATRLATGLEDAARSAGIPHTIGWFNSMMTLFFTPDPVTDWDTAARCDTQRYACWFWGLMDRGVYMPCSQFEALFVSTAHTEADIDATLAAAREVAAALD
jgi:glutamate-1-semialdehyde 2,1-aminomutase